MVEGTTQKPVSWKLDLLFKILKIMKLEKEKNFSYMVNTLAEKGVESYIKEKNIDLEVVEQ